jgi:2-hydroxy-3-keto-5-methylthiopentenyl-1-phosphate phosphatase
MKNYSLFIDFDYTITTDDVGNRFYTYFSKGKNEPLVEKWLKREITTRECLTEEARLCRGSKAEFIKYVDKFEIDLGFPELVNLCSEAGIPLYVLSDGLDFYISHILGKYGIREIDIYSNKAIFDNGGLKVELPHWTKKCVSCGNCKGERIRQLKGKDDEVIYIGDGLSDLCGAREADLIFAKDDLARFLEEETREYIEYDTLFEVKDKLRGILKTARK